MYIGTVNDGGITIDPVGRFENRPVERGGRYVWDLDRLLENLRQEIDTVLDSRDVDTIAVDTWGVDFGLLADGEPLADPYSYRDPKLDATIGEITEAVSRFELFRRTGINHWNLPNTLWQYHHLATEQPDLLAQADRLVMMPQLIATQLGARLTGEPTIASTTQMLDPQTREWDRQLLDRLGLPTEPLPDLKPAGTTIGTLATADVDIVLPASHDTASAVAGLPLDDGSAFLSTGTWFIVGLELDSPVLTREAFEIGASNELGANDTVRFLSNINGFFLLEECREHWAADGDRPDYDTLLAAAAEATTDAVVNPDDPLFGIEGAMPDRIRRYCRQTDQPAPETRGAVVRVIVRSLATKAALQLADLTTAAGTSIDRLYLGGGGVRNDLFCHHLAAAVDLPVYAGAADATAVGNILLQAVAAGTVSNLTAGRRLVAEGLPLREYKPPTDVSAEAARDRMRGLCDRTIGDD
ncbi:rhamnulokinase [Halobellus salinus]|uniref:Rhamnulokinase n=1 Tax=Halobellus salinus TaxID=931585 RepID=A0A830EG24_9EURY|nr:rhamnulokinase [Halobellus salinus]